jgi:hypothetical protein
MSDNITYKIRRGYFKRIIILLSKKICKNLTDSFINLYEGKTFKQLRDERININDIDMQFHKNFEEKVDYINGVVLPIYIHDENFISEFNDVKLLIIKDNLALEKSNQTLEFNTAEERKNFVTAEKDMILKKIKILVDSGTSIILTTSEVDLKYIHFFSENKMVINYISLKTLDKFQKILGVSPIISIINQKINEKNILCIDKMKILYNKFISLNLKDQKYSTLILNSPTDISINHMKRYFFL